MLCSEVMTQKIARQFRCNIYLVLREENGKWLAKYIFNDRAGGRKNLPELPLADSPQEATSNALNLMESLVKDHLAQWMFKACEDLTGASSLVGQ